MAAGQSAGGRGKGFKQVGRLELPGAGQVVVEGNYAYIGQRLAAGDRLYVDVWDHQPPGVFALTAAVARVHAAYGWDQERTFAELVNGIVTQSGGDWIAELPAGT